MFILTSNQCIIVLRKFPYIGHARCTELRTLGRCNFRSNETGKTVYYFQIDVLKILVMTSVDEE